MLKEDAFTVAGRFARFAGSGVVARAVTSKDNIRVALTHEVPPETLGQFHTIVRYLTRARGVITPEEFFRHYESDEERTPIRGRSILFSFDDGLLSSYRAAKQVLEPLGIKAVFFVPTAVLELEDQNDMRQFAWERLNFRALPIEALRPDQYVTMTRRELLELHAEGHAVFPHTHSHPKVSAISTVEEFETELRRPRAILEDLLQTTCDAFAFPVGNERTIDAASFEKIAQVYSYCFTALSGTNTEKTHPLLLHRDFVHPWHSLRQVETILGGTYDAYHGLRHGRLGRKIHLQSRSRTVPSSRAAPEDRAVDSPPGRRRFIEAVARELDTVGAEYVFLHGYERDHGVDSDIDIAVDRKSLDVIDATIRRGVFGRLVQSLHYADPWCRYYVVRVDEAGRRYRELDVACDPWGIGAYGPAVQVALGHVMAEGGLRVPSPAAQTLYLAIKKARKRRADQAAHELLTRAFAGDPSGSRELLEKHLGRAGRDLARALETGSSDISAELAAVRGKLKRRSLHPAIAGRRAAFRTSRSLRRLLRPTGLAVAITAPDGAGKTTLARNLEAAAHGPFRRFCRYHLRPGLLPPPARLLGRTPAGGEKPHGRAPSGVAGSLVRLAYLWIDTFFGWVPKVRIPEARSTLVILERGWLDLVVDPRRYRLSSPVALTRLLARMLPQPAVTLRLEAPAEVLAQRTSELDEQELGRQLDAWRDLAAGRPERFAVLDASRPMDDVLEQALDVIDDRLASRQDDLRSCELALAGLGGLRVGGEPYRIVFARQGPLARRPRWLLPIARGARGPLANQLYRPGHRLYQAPALALEVVQRLGIPRVGRRVTVGIVGGLSPLIAEALGVPDVQLAAAVTGDTMRGDRALVSVSRGGVVIAFAKVAREEGAKLATEHRLLETLGSCDLETIVVPETLGLFEWNGATVLLLRPFHAGNRVDRPLGEIELRALEELARLSKLLTPILAEGPGCVPVHGDFTPWNSAPRAGERLVLWDWEEARLGLALEDLFNWRLQRMMRLGRGTVTDVVAAAVEPAQDVTALCERLSISPEIAPTALKTCIRRMLESRPMADAGPPWVDIGRDLDVALAELAKAERRRARVPSASIPVPR